MGAIFYNGNGGISSIRSTARVGNHKVENTSYYSTGRGGVTFHNRTMTTRLNSDGRSLGVGTGYGSRSYYNGRSFSSNIGRF